MRFWMLARFTWRDGCLLPQRCMLLQATLVVENPVGQVVTRTLA